MAGHEYPRQDVSYYTRDALLFANSIGCKDSELQFLYELHPQFQVFPTYPTVLAYKGTDSEVLDALGQASAPEIPGLSVKLDGSRGVDGQKYFRVFKPLPRNSSGHQLELRKKIVGVYDKGKAGTVLETTTSLVDKVSGEVYTTEIGSVFFVGQGGWGGEKGPKPTVYAVPGRKADAVVEVKTSKEAALLYRLNGDYNPLHAEPGPGTKMGFGGAILHGLCTWNMVAHSVLQTFGGSQAANLREFQARFSSPVKPGDVLTTEMWRTGVKEDGFEEVLFVTKVGGKPVLSNGRALVRVEQGSASAKL